MADEQDAASKTEEATPQKLQKAREKGDVAKTPDLAMLASFAGAAAVIAIAGGWMSRHLASELLPFIAHPDDFDLKAGGLDVAIHAARAAAPVLLAVLAVASLMGAAGNLVQTGLLFSPEKIKPDWKKLSPMSGLKRILGPDGLMQFVKSLAKVAMVGWVGWVVMKPYIHPLKELAALDPAAMLPLMIEILRKLVFATAALMLVIAGLDWFWQRARFLKRMRMTKEEQKEEFKNAEGDPHVKAKRRQIAIQRSRSRMMAAVPNATMVIMNPTHYAVALKYERGVDQAPVIVAKGQNLIAQKIKAIAREHGVPMVENRPVAQMLFKMGRVGSAIPYEMYQVVAEILAVTYKSHRYYFHQLKIRRSQRRTQSKT